MGQRRSFKRNNQYRMVVEQKFLMQDFEVGEEKRRRTRGPRCLAYEGKPEDYRKCQHKDGKPKAGIAEFMAH